MSITSCKERRRNKRLWLVILTFLTCLSSSSVFKIGLCSAGADDDGADNAAAKSDDGNDRLHDDSMVWTKDFDDVSVMAISCINYNNGHMIRFDFYDSDSSYQCHFNALGSFVVSIAHYMRAHFNKQALLYGSDFALPEDAGYLNCVMLQETEYASRKLYAKIGCMQRETFTSTKLQLHVYQDAQCSIPYDDGETNKRHTSKGYEINGYYLSTRVSFRPAFYSCQTCNPDGVAETFNKKTGNWYDDDYITTHGKKTNTTSNDDGNKAEEHINDDAYFYSNDDVASNDDARYNANVGDGSDDHQASQTQYAHNDDYSAGDDRRVLRFIDPNVNNLPTMSAVPESLALYETEFWSEVEERHGTRSLYENYYDVGDWNMCNQIHKYGIWCNNECKSLDAFRVDEWSKSDVFLLVIMCVFMAAMMLLVVAKRLKAAQKARLYGDENYKPGLPPHAMALIFLLIMSTIFVLAEMKFVNETLVFAVVTCILLFIYMLKLTLFESRRPVLLATPKHDSFDNPWDNHIFE